MHSEPVGRRGRPTRRAVLGTIAGVAAAGAAGAYAWDRLGHGSGGSDDRGAAAAGGTGTGPGARTAGPHTFERLTAPERTVVRAADGGTLATFTDGARTAVLTGPTRSFSEPRTTEAKVTTDAWVRVLPHEWQRGMEKSAWFKGWFRKALGDTSPDVFAVAFEYSSAGAPDKHNAAGVRYAGTAHFGPRNAKVNNPLDFAYHDEQSDFYDYLGIDWTFPDGTRVQPEQARYGDVDCSGFQRLVWGYRMGIPLHNTNTRGSGLPRRAFAIAAYGPGRLVIPDTGEQPTGLDVLQPGDLVFFAIIKDRPNFIDHCGMYMGLDDQGRHRFYSSRSAANGPTLGDLSGRSLLDGTGFYARGFRAVRRL
ncbi:NlpC/P60 family protein [Streptomyces sp. FXJ1.172]|uniref:NlpC/P60 family protein n=1 Tax=Streptomyces sp. FXJ1.172 TaxID=710705 RepID=UPI0007D00307|nr:NlpC/P60 family protein [Streptomyces sp. FXJ1.172]WEO93607.1 NlpC/P60 family protein [Streptomyces sp. FXJ1.172]